MQVLTKKAKKKKKSLRVTINKPSSRQLLQLVKGWSFFFLLGDQNNIKQKFQNFMLTPFLNFLSNQTEGIWKTNLLFSIGVTEDSKNKQITLTYVKHATKTKPIPTPKKEIESIIFHPIIQETFGNTPSLDAEKHFPDWAKQTITQLPFPRSPQIKRDQMPQKLKTIKQKEKIK